MRNPTHNYPPLLTGPGGDFVRPCWPAARGWWTRETLWSIAAAFIVLMFFAFALWGKC